MSAQTQTGTARLEEIAKQLEQSASELRSAEVDAERTTALVARCAELASQASIELDRIAGAAPEGSLPGQEELL